MGAAPLPTPPPAAARDPVAYKCATTGCMVVACDHHANLQFRTIDGTDERVCIRCWMAARRRALHLSAATESPSGNAALTIDPPPSGSAAHTIGPSRCAEKYVKVMPPTDCCDRQ